MSTLEYVNLNQVHPDEFLPVLNHELVRLHLIAHGIFDSVSIKDWVNGKLQADATPGCRVRAIYVDHVLAGWCGIQPVDTGFEIAIVLSQHFWGFGMRIFKTLMCWAHAFGHKEVRLHLLDTRPEYMFLKRQAIKVQKTALLGRRFTTYWISVAEWRSRGTSSKSVKRPAPPMQTPFHAKGYVLQVGETEFAGQAPSSKQVRKLGYTVL